MGLTEVESVFAGICHADKRMVAQAITWIEDRDIQSEALLERVYPLTGKTHVIGITGPPGAGKSTLVNQLARIGIEGGRRVGVLAVDPSSPFSQGAVLGDRVRMRDVSGHRNVFIRSLASRGHPGGLSRSAADVVKIFDGAGMDMVLVETVGVGQSEVAIRELAHTTVVIDVPNAGDMVQTLKAGVLETADIFVVNKCDLAGAERTVMQLREMLSMRGHMREKPDGVGEWTIPVVKTNAMTGEGMAEVARAADAHRQHLKSSGLWLKREVSQLENEVVQLLREDVVPRLLSRARQSGLWDALLPLVVSRQLSPLAMARRLAQAGE